MMNYKPPYQFEEGALLLIDKPKYWTSFDVVNKIRFILRKITGNKKIKVGHAGTLDPLATGLLLICTGKYTKSIDLLMGQSKTYEGSIKLGVTTASYDAETEETQPISIDHLELEDLIQASMQFKGKIMQKPPLFSAIKQEGKKLYDLARKGQEVEIKLREIEIHSFSIVEYKPPEVFFEVNCSKGTYIRSLAYDFGIALKNQAYLSNLRRTTIGDYHVNNAWQLTDFIEEYSK